VFVISGGHVSYPKPIGFQGFMKLIGIYVCMYVCRYCRIVCSDNYSTTI